jgi:transposase
VITLAVPTCTPASKRSIARIIAASADQFGRPERDQLGRSLTGDAVRLTKSGKTITQVARELDLTETALREWVRRAEADAGERQDVLTTEERQELARLRRENKQLRQEREILKAAATFFAKENA